MFLRSTNFSAWYNHLIKKAGLAEQSSTRGCIVFKPYGFSLWEKIRNILDNSFKVLGHQNAYFPLFIPMSHFSKEAQHVDGFAKECAVVTHYRLKHERDGVDVDPQAKLEEPFIVRPTSETVIWEHFAKWIRSHRDLPMRINQWANVVRWEKRTRPFLRTLEFLWQEGHTAHATQQEAKKHALTMLDNYIYILNNHMALPLVAGEKTIHERFAGAENTYTMEGMMQDGKALQLGTSHFLGQHFARAFCVTFTNKEDVLEYVWGTSWGVTTRLLGALIMTHADDRGLVIPPKIAPIQVIIVPIYHKSIDEEVLKQHAQSLASSLRNQHIAAKVDDTDTHSPGWKFAEYETKGIPLRISIGPRDIRNHTVEIVRRDTLAKKVVLLDEAVNYVSAMLETIQQEMYDRALALREQSTCYVDDFDTFRDVMKTKKGFIMAHWDGTTATELAIQEATTATIRCIPFDAPKEEGRCVYTGAPSKQRVLFAQAY